MKGKKDDKDISGGAPAWMVTYGDMMSLLLCFFVLLASMSSIQESKFRQALGSLLGALGVMRFDSSVVDFEELSIQEKYEEEVEQIREQFDLFKGFIKKRRLDKAIEIMETEEGMLIRMANPILFESGKADLRPEAYEVLERLFGILSTFDAKIRVEGHTDNVPINNERYPSNWELSAARAINVLKFFNRLGIEGERLTAVGHGKFHPLVDNDTPENRSQNRRVEIRVDYKEDLERTTIRRLLKENENEEDSDG